MTVVRLASCYSQISRDLQRGIRGWKGFSFVAQQIWSEAMAPANKIKSVSVERKGLKVRASGAEQRMIVFCSSTSHAKAELTTVALRAVAIDLLRANLNILTRIGIITETQ